MISIKKSACYNVTKTAKLQVESARLIASKFGAKHRPNDFKPLRKLECKCIIVAGGLR